MGHSIEYQKQMSTFGYITLLAPADPETAMSGGELLHGFLAELYKSSNPELKNTVMQLCFRWNVHYVEQK